MADDAVEGAAAAAATHPSLSAAAADSEWELEPEILMPGSCSMVADEDSRSPVRLSAEESRYQKLWAQGQAARRDRSRPAQSQRAGGRGVDCRTAVKQTRWPQAPLNWTQIARACEDVINAEVDACSANFKIGLAADSRTRFDFYRREGVTRMVLLHSTDDPNVAIRLERNLISCYRTGPRCRNVAPGGKGINTLVTPVHVYVAFGGEGIPETPRLLEFWPRSRRRKK